MKLFKKILAVTLSVLMGALLVCPAFAAGDVCVYKLPPFHGNSTEN